jgi:arsenical-resistance protein 2
MTTTTDVTSAAAAPPPWHAAYPAPKNAKPATVTKDEVRDWLVNGSEKYVLVDVRRVDFEVVFPPPTQSHNSGPADAAWVGSGQGGTIKTAINLPAQSLHPTIPSLYRLFRDAQVKKLVFWCSELTPFGCCSHFR